MNRFWAYVRGLMSGLRVAPLPSPPHEGEGIRLRLRFHCGVELLAVSLLLVACASPEPVVTAVPVSVPVVAACKVAAPERPVSFVAGLSREATLFEQVRAALGEIEARRAYEAEQEAAVMACVSR